MKAFKLETFGSFQLWIGGQPINQFRTYKIRDLLIYLTVKANLPHQRDHLAALLWSDYPDKVARTNLRNTLAHLRKILSPVLADDPAFLVANRQTIQLNLNREAHSADALTIESVLATYQRHSHQDDLLCNPCAEQLTQIGILYQGEFLSGLNQTGNTLFDEWRLQQQEHYHRQMTLVYKALARHYFQQCNYTQAERYARYQLSLEPWLEEAHQQLIRALALNGERAAALAQYDICKQVLDKELKVSPSPDTDRLVEQIRTESLFEHDKGLNNKASAIPALNLPAGMTPFFGRETELAQLNQLLLDPAYRLITLVGSGGIGKTRLASTAAEHAIPHFADGVWFVSLVGVELSSDTKQDSEEAEAISVENGIATAIAEALNLTFYEKTSPKVQLLAYLHQKKLLLILDNFEHLLQGINFIVEVLKKAQNVSLLVTSREQFSLQAEYVMHIEGLSVPNLESASDIPSKSQFQSNSSVQLFAERADRTRRGFTLDSNNRKDVARICRFLEGLPLGIELAAAWVKVMSCADIAQAVEQNLDFLATSKRDVSNRHRSLRAVFEGSWQMLSSQEQRVLSQASIFRGNFSHDAAGFIAEATPVILVNLVDKSLVQLIVPGRYQLHELLRQFAAEKLTELVDQPNLSELATQAEEQHTKYYLNFIQQRAQALNGHQARIALNEIKQEITNIRYAWQCAVSQVQIELIKKSLEALSQYYHLMGLFEEGIVACEVAANRLLNSSELPKAKIQLILGDLYIEQAKFFCEQTNSDQAISAARLALELGQTINSRILIVSGHMLQGRALWHQGKFKAAQKQHDLSLKQAQGDFPQLEANNLSILSNIYSDQGDYAQAYIYDKQALYLYHGLSNKRKEASMLGNLGHITTYFGDYSQSQYYQEQALQIRRQIGDLQGEAISLEAFGNLYYRIGNYELSQQYLKTALKIYEQIGDQEGIGYALTYLGNVFIGFGDLKKATETYNRALQVRKKAKQFHLISEDQAGLAQVALIEGELDLAQLQVEAILAFLEHNTLKGEDIFRIYLTCFHVLKANHDARAQKIIKIAYQHLQTQAEKIEAEGLRRSFLENVTLHREVVHEWRLMNSAFLLQE